MIAASVLLILVAIGLLVAGVLASSNALIVCCLIVVIVAAVVLVTGVKQSVATGARFGLDYAVDAQETGLLPALAWHGFQPRRSDSRINEQTALHATVPAPGAPVAFPSGVRSDGGGSTTVGQLAVPVQTTTSSYGESPAFADPIVVGSTYRSQVEPVADVVDDGLADVDEVVADPGTGRGIAPDASTVDVGAYGDGAYGDGAYGDGASGDGALDGRTRDIETLDVGSRDIETFGMTAPADPILDEDAAYGLSGTVVDALDDDFGDASTRHASHVYPSHGLDYGPVGASVAEPVEALAAFDPDDDPPDEPLVQAVTPANAARVAVLTTDVLVVDGRPRYHVAGCAHLNDRETEPLPVNEAVELGFTPCALCEPDSAILANARRV